MCSDMWAGKDTAIKGMRARRLRAPPERPARVRNRRPNFGQHSLLAGSQGRFTFPQQFRFPLQTGEAPLLVQIPTCVSIASEQFVNVSCHPFSKHVAPRYIGTPNPNMPSGL
jgi:hypothetical protein